MLANVKMNPFCKTWHDFFTQQKITFRIEREDTWLQKDRNESLPLKSHDQNVRNFKANKNFPCINLFCFGIMYFFVLCDFLAE